VGPVRSSTADVVAIRRERALTRPRGTLASVTSRRAHIAVIQHEDGCPLGLFDGWLRSAGADLTVVRPYVGEPLPGVGDAGGLIVLGGSMSATDVDRHPWLASTRDLMRRAVDRGLPTLGICLGHQLLTVALGGTVGPNPAGKQMGVVPVGLARPAAHERLFASLVERGDVGAIQWNNEIALAVPSGATVLAATPAGVPQAMRVGEAAWGVQFHPEADEVIVTDWARSEGPVTQVEAAAIADIASAAPMLEATWQAFAAEFVAIAADRRASVRR
jgi:GMP synthase (glutamine-hydrolysing)